MELDLQPILQNEWLLLKPLKQTHYASLFKAASNPLIWKQHTADRYKPEEFDKYFTASMESKGALVVVDKSIEKIIGSSRFQRLDSMEDAVEIGWSFLSMEYWGGQYNQAMKKLMIDHAFKSISNVVFYIDQDNIRSQRATQKIGGKKIDPLDYPNLAKDKPKHFIYLIRKEDWEIQ